MVQTFAKKKRAFFSFLVVLGCVASCDFSKRAGLWSRGAEKNTRKY